MKRICTLGILVSFVFCLIGCKEGGSQKASSVFVQEINLASNQYATTLSEFVDSVSFLKLKETNESFFVAISKLIISDSVIYIFDKFGSNRVVAFDANGNYVTVYGSRGNGESEYVRLGDFDVDSNLVYLYDRRKKRMLCYLHDGTFVKAMYSEFLGKGFKMLPNGKFLFALSKDERLSKLCLTDSILNIERSLLLYNEEDNDDYEPECYFRELNDSVYYNHAVSDSVYVFSHEGRMVSCYHLDFDGRNVPDEEKVSFENFSEMETQREYIYI